MCGERAGRKLEKDVRRAEETCGKKYIEFERDGVFTEEEGKSECEVSANETHESGATKMRSSGMNETHGHRDGGGE